MEPTSFALADGTVNDFTVVSVRGELDLATAPHLRDHLDEHVDGGKAALVVDLSGTTFLDSTALGVLVNVMKRCRDAGGDLALVIADPRISKIFAITGLNDTFAIYGSIEELSSRASPGASGPSPAS